MSRLDRLVRAVAPSLEEDEGLLASVLGRLDGRRNRAALVATDRRLLLVTERFGGATAEDLPYAEITTFERSDTQGKAAVEVVAPAGRWRLERIPVDAASRVALELMQRRCEHRGSTSLRARGVGTSGEGRPARVRILT